MVVLHHVASISDPFKGLFDFGRTGVLLFYLISGYCIAFTLERPSERPLSTFWIRRSLRLYPPYWATMALAAVIGSLSFPVKIWLINLTMVQQGMGVPDVVGVFWTLYFEMLFYALASLLAKFDVLRKAGQLLAVWGALLVLSASAAIAKARFGVPVPFSYPLFLSMFFAGALLHRLDASQRPWPMQWVAVTIAGGLVTVMLISRIVYGDSAIGSDTWLSHFGNHAAALLTFLVFSKVVRLEAPWLVFLGHISYSLYLVHTVVAEWGGALLGSEAPSVIVIPVKLAISLAAAVAMHFTIERPAIRLARDLAGRLGRPVIATVPAE